MFTMINPPTVEPLEVETAKLWARIDGNAFDGLLPMMIGAARQVAEQETGLRLITQTLRADLTDWPAAGDVMPLYPVQSFAFSHWDGSGWLDEPDGAAVPLRVLGGYTVGRQVGAAAYPSLPAWTGPRVRLTAVVGYGDTPDSVPLAIRQFIAAHVAYWVRNPEAAQETRYSMVRSPFLAGLLDPFRTFI